MRVLSVTYNLDYDRTRVKVAKEFEGAGYVIKMDVLNDLIGDLMTLRTQVSQEWNNVPAKGTTEGI